MNIHSLFIGSIPIDQDKADLVQHPPIGTGRPRPSLPGQAGFGQPGYASSSSQTSSPPEQNAVFPDLPAMQAPLPPLPQNTPPLKPLARDFRPAAHWMLHHHPPSRPFVPPSQHLGGNNLPAVPPASTQRELDLEVARARFRGRSRQSLQQEYNQQQQRITTLTGATRMDEIRRNSLLQQVIEEMKLKEKERRS